MGRKSRLKEKRRAVCEAMTITQLPWDLLQSSDEFRRIWVEARVADFRDCHARSHLSATDLGAEELKVRSAELEWDMLGFRIPPLLAGLYQESNSLLWSGNHLYFLIASDLMLMLQQMDAIIPLCWLVLDVDGRYTRRLDTDDPAYHQMLPDVEMHPLPRTMLGRPVMYLDTPGAFHSPAVSLVVEKRSNIIQPKSRIILPS